MIRRMVGRLLRGPTPAPRTTPPRHPTPSRPPTILPDHTGAPSPDVHRELLLVKFDACPYCKTVARAIERLGIDVPVSDTRRDPTAAQQHRQKTGRTQVPCLYIDGFPLFESRDIVDWLESYSRQAA